LRAAVAASHDGKCKPNEPAAKLNAAGHSGGDSVCDTHHTSAQTATVYQKV